MLTLPTAARIRELLHYDPETGVFSRRVRCGKFAANTTPGWTDTNGYRVIRISGKNQKAHRLAWLYMTGRWPRHEVDHIDGDRVNNRYANLRDVTKHLNMQNLRAATKRNQLGLLGVSRITTGRFQAGIFVDGKQRHLGLFDDPEAAHLMYLLAKREYHLGNTL